MSTPKATNRTPALAERQGSGQAPPASAAAPVVQPSLPTLGIEQPSSPESETSVATTSCGNVDGSAADGALRNALRQPSKTGRKAGGQPDNEGAVRTGVSLWKRKGRLPRRHKGARKNLVAEGHKVEAELLAEAPLSAWQSRLLGSFMRAEGICTLLDIELAAHADTMTRSELCTVAAQLRAADDAGTKLLKELGLDHDRGGKARATSNGHHSRANVDLPDDVVFAALEAAGSEAEAGTANDTEDQQ
jgi:hypothetical protein